MADADRAAARQWTLSPMTLMPLGVVVATVGALVTGAYWLDDQFDGVRMELVEVKQRIASMESVLSDRWTTSQMRTWAALLAARNQELHVPDVER